MAGTRAKALAKMQAAYTEATAASSLQRSDSLMVQTFIYRGHVWRGSVDTTKAVKDKMSAVVKKALRSILALHPRDCSSDVLYGDTTSTRWPLMPNCVQHRCQNMELADGPRRRAILIRGYGVGRPVARTGGNVNHY
jgi:hypothetical protein